MAFINSLVYLMAFSGVLIGACQRVPSPKSMSSPDQTDKPRPTLVMNDFKTQFYGKAGLQWELISPYAEGYPEENIMRAVDLDIQLYDEGVKSTHIEAGSGEINTRNPQMLPPDPPLSVNGIILQPGDMFLSDDVVAVSTDGTKLLTPWAHFKRKEDIIVSTAAVQVLRDDSVTTGVGLEASADMSSLKIFNQTVVIRDENEAEEAP